MIYGTTENLKINGLILPNMADVIGSWASNYKALRITKTMNNFVLTEETEEIKFQGMVQALNTKELQLKPEGERNWGWYKLHSTYKFNNDDLIIVLGIRYRVMSTRQDNTYYGFYVFNLLQDYKGVADGNPTNNL